MAKPRKTSASTKKRVQLTGDEEADCRRLAILWKAYAEHHPEATQAWLAERLGISQGGVSHYLNGRNALNIETVLKFCKATKIPVELVSPRVAELLPDQPPSKPGKPGEQLLPAEEDLVTWLHQHTQADRQRMARTLQLLAIALLETPVTDARLEEEGWGRPSAAS